MFFDLSFQRAPGGTLSVQKGVKDANPIVRFTRGFIYNASAHAPHGAEALFSSIGNTHQKVAAPIRIWRNE